jgi:hypothetical protein
LTHQVAILFGRFVVSDRGMIDRRGIEQRWKADGSKRDERGRRVFAASEARAAGCGLAVVSEITGLARSTIGRGIKDLDVATARGQVRRQGVCLAIECSGRELWPGASSIVRSAAVLSSICD